MSTIFWLIVIIAIVLYYRKRKKENVHTSESSLEPPSSNNEQPKSQNPMNETEQPQNHQSGIQMHDRVVWQDDMRKLWFDGNTLKLRYRGKDYTFSSHGYEPMAIILKRGEAVVYIHNSFDVEHECKQFSKNSNYRCCTITGRLHDAKHFCLLLTTAIDDGYDWQIDELERRVDEQTRFETREVWYKENGIDYLFLRQRPEDPTPTT